MADKIPRFFIDMLTEQYGEELLSKILEGLSCKRSVTLRINTLKTSVQNIKEILTQNGFLYSEVTWSKEALILQCDDEEKIRNLEMYKNGEIYLQSLSSMLPVIVLLPNADENILDMAAAPGGKTTQIATISNNRALITACEKNKVRFERLKYNIQKQGASRVNLLLEDSRKLDDYFSFDKILLDSPCSGSGTLNINDDITKYFSKELVDRSVRTQQELLKKAIKILKKGHEMVYSTCSILKNENEDNIIKLLKNDSNIEVVPIDEEIFKDIPLLPVSIKGTICVCPSRDYEGFFIAKLRKK